MNNNNNNNNGEHLYSAFPHIHAQSWNWKRYLKFSNIGGHLGKIINGHKNHTNHPI